MDGEHKKEVPNNDIGENAGDSMTLHNKPKIRDTDVSTTFMRNKHDYFIHKPWFPPSEFTLVSHHHPPYHAPIKYTFNSIQRLFVCLDHPSSCKLGVIISNLLNLGIVLSVICFILGADPKFMHHSHHCSHPACHKGSTLCPKYDICEPVHDHTLELIDDVIMFIFSLEYFLVMISVPFVPARIAHCVPNTWELKHPGEPEPKYNPFVQMGLFSLKFKSLIDIATILPFWILLFTSKPGDPRHFAFIRVLRLLRILHIFKITKHNKILHLVERTMKLSAPTIALSVFLLTLLIVFFGSLIHFCESGVFMVTEEHKYGAFFRDLGHGHFEVSPFVDISTGIYWVILMITATGAGGTDLMPITTGGKIVAVLSILVGVILLAIPLGVIGLNFTNEYELMLKHFKKAHGGHSVDAINILDVEDDDSISESDDLEISVLKNIDPAIKNDQKYIALGNARISPTEEISEVDPFNSPNQEEGKAKSDTLFQRIGQLEAENRELKEGQKKILQLLETILGSVQK